MVLVFCTGRVEVQYRPTRSACYVMLKVNHAIPTLLFLYDIPFAENRLDIIFQRQNLHYGHLGHCRSYDRKRNHRQDFDLCPWGLRKMAQWTAEFVSLWEVASQNRLRHIVNKLVHCNQVVSAGSRCCFGSACGVPTTKVPHIPQEEGLWSRYLDGLSLPPTTLSY